MFVYLFLSAIILQTINADLPLCVWYGSAPFCGSGRTCPGNYPYKIDQCASSDQAVYCSSTFGSKCWTDVKLLCCNADINPQDTNSYVCGNMFLEKVN